MAIPDLHSKFPMAFPALLLKHPGHCTSPGDDGEPGARRVQMSAKTRADSLGWDGRHVPPSCLSSSFTGSGKVSRGAEGKEGLGPHFLGAVGRVEGLGALPPQLGMLTAGGTQHAPTAHL